MFWLYLHIHKWYNSLTTLKFDSIAISKITHLHSEIGLIHTSHQYSMIFIIKTETSEVAHGKYNWKCCWVWLCVLCSFIFFYATIRFVSPYIYKSVCKICNTLVKYKDVHAKADVKDVSFETELHRWFGLLDSTLVVFL